MQNNNSSGPGYDFFFGRTSVRSCKIGVVRNNWFVGNAVFSKRALGMFLIFCIKLGDYKGRKEQSRIFEKRS